MRADPTADLEQLEKDALGRVADASSVDELAALTTELLGKRSDLARLGRSLGELELEERRRVGAVLQGARGRIEDAIAERRVDLEARERDAAVASERLDLTEVTGGSTRGHLHLLTQTRDELEDVFVGMGYRVAEGPEVETDWYNFEALNMPPAHPARGLWDTLYLTAAEGRPEESTLLRTHTSPVQIRVMASQPPPIYVVAPGRVYRRDTPDARHLATFHQIEGLVVDRGITFGDLAGTIETFTGAYFGPGMHSRLRPSYFPFTEPSAELEVTCVICRGAGCRTCTGTGWVELGGCGMVHPNVLAAVGIDAEEWSGFAFGFGIDRCAQMRHQIPDMRVFLDNDVRLLSQF
ncbi:MAG TPA: phenylalanine--tRNA ligase subunit alpha [Acidimicrobiales bacterium]|nr:phenylalanine--tRNA ligase subunit alpha [Acidimicrobiales bacterium]